MAGAADSGRRGMRVRVRVLLLGVRGQCRLLQGSKETQQQGSTDWQETAHYRLLQEKALLATCSTPTMARSSRAG
jgi:hypothetical protein